MEKSKRSKEKDAILHKGKIWKDETNSYIKRKTGSGVTYGGYYVEKE